MNKNRMIEYLYDLSFFNKADAKYELNRSYYIYSEDCEFRKKLIIMLFVYYITTRNKCDYRIKTEYSYK